MGREDKLTYVNNIVLYVNMLPNLPSTRYNAKKALECVELDHRSKHYCLNNCVSVIVHTKHS